ncbi:MAG: carboxypeptidase-like regulatory domain-containing protein [Armatimonadetes bacterium]|nr:carboxypeptidase-like regulatory domain-containing protein [Armatimonadota bacterium]
MSSRFHKVLQLVILSVTFSLLLCGSASASGEEYIWATGKVLDKSGKPVRNAYIAVYDDNNKVIDYANTDQNGDYALAVPRHVMHIDKKGKGFLTQVFGTVTRFVGGATDFVNNPLRAGIKAITSSEAAAVLNPIQKGTISAGGAVADQILLRLKTPSSKPSVQEERKQPGVLLIKVIGENSQDLVGTARVYWMQQETLKAGGRETRTTTAWLESKRKERRTPSLTISPSLQGVYCLALQRLDRRSKSPYVFPSPPPQRYTW